MTITADIPISLQENFERTARAVYDRDSIQHALIEAIELWLKQHQPLEAEQLMAQEIAAFGEMHGQLWAKYPYYYVAIYKGQLIDHDKDQHALFLRIEEQYPTQVILIRQVCPDVERIYTVHSTRFVPELNGLANVMEIQG